MPTTPAVRLLVTDDLERSRLTVFFRLLLVLPHLLWLALWGVAAFVVAIVNWVVTLIQGTPAEALHDFLAAYIRYAVQVYGYLYLAANPYPRFDGRPGYPVEVEIEPPQRQNRWTVGFRLVLAVPAVLVATALTGSFSAGGASSSSATGLLTTVAVLGWFAALFTARMPRGLRDAATYAIAYGAQLSAYLLVVTDRYPSSDPLTTLGALPVRTDPIRIEVDDDLRRSRLTVFFRLLLALPHLVWLSLWAVVAVLAAIVNWFATLVTGRPPDALHRFLSAYLRYATHVLAYLHLIANPFPGFTGKPGTYPVQLVVDGPQEQNRWTVAFRIVLFVPVAIVASAYGGLVLVVALLGWFASLFTAQMPDGLRNAGALALRYSGQAYGYLFLVTGSYPYSGPVAGTAASTGTPQPPPNVEPIPLAPLA